MTIEERIKKAKELGAIKHVEVEDGKYNFFFKKPHRHALGLAMGKLEINPIEANEILINNSIIREVSDVDSMQDDEVFFAIIKEMGDVMAIKKSTSKTL